MDSNTTIETKDGRTTVTTGNIRTVFPAGDVNQAAAQIGLVQGMVERLECELAEKTMHHRVALEHTVQWQREAERGILRLQQLWKRVRAAERRADELEERAEP